jgi:Putative MetA-pathway of phenol degradation
MWLSRSWLLKSKLHSNPRHARFEDSRRDATNPAVHERRDRRSQRLGFRGDDVRIKDVEYLRLGLDVVTCNPTGLLAKMYVPPPACKKLGRALLSWTEADCSSRQSVLNKPCVCLRMSFLTAGFVCVSLLLAVLGGILASQAGAQSCGANAQSPIATDRPQITSSSIVVPCGGLQFENGFQETGNGGQRTFDLPETSVRLGIASKTELRFGVPDYFYNDNDAAPAFGDGFGDLSLGFKQQLGPARGGFDVSLIPSVSLPTGANLISSHGYDPTVQLPWSRSLTKNWTVAGMFSLMWPTEARRRNLTGQSSAYFDRQLMKRWDAFVEYSVSFPKRGGPQNMIDFGTAYKITPHQQLDFHCNFGLSAATADHSIGFGYSVRFQVFQSR